MKSRQTHVKCPDCAWPTHRTYDTEDGYGTCSKCPSTKRMVPAPPPYHASREAKIAADFARMKS